MSTTMSMEAYPSTTTTMKSGNGGDEETPEGGGCCGENGTVTPTPTPTPTPTTGTENNNTNTTTTTTTSSVVAVTVAVCCGCRPKAKSKTKKYIKESSQRGWLRVFHSQRGTAAATTRRYKDTLLGNDSEWTAFHQHHATHPTHNKKEEDNDEKKAIDNDNDNDDESSSSSMFFFDAVDQPLGENEFPFPFPFPIDGYAIGGPNSGIVFTTSIEHPAPKVTMDDPTTMLRHSAKEAALSASSAASSSSRNDSEDDNDNDDDNDDNDDNDDDSEIEIEIEIEDRRASISNHKEPSARFRRIRKRSTSELQEELKNSPPSSSLSSSKSKLLITSKTSKTTPTTPTPQTTTTNSNTNNLENAIGLAGYPGTLTIDELNECQKFLEGIKKLDSTILEQVYSLRDIEETPYTICRWLRATKFNSNEILQRLQDNQYMFDEAKEHQFYGPNISQYMNNCPLSVFLSQYPFLPLGRGYNGCPVNYFLAGKINPEGILCLCTISQLKNYFWYSFMYKMKIEMKESQKQNIDFCKCEGINVLDLKGLSTSSLTTETMNVIKLSSKISDFFPETLHCMLIINAPSFFSFAWKIIKKFIDPRTASRIQLFSSSNEKMSQQALEKLICKQTQLPKDYGGGNISLEDSFLNEVQQSNPLITKQNIELLYTRKGKKLTSTVQILKSWPIKENETIDITIYTRSVSEATITILFDGIPIKTIQAQCLFSNDDDGDYDNNNDVGNDNDNDNQKPYPNRIVVSDYDASSSSSSKEQQLLVSGPGEVTVTATDLDSPISKEKQYSNLSRGYFLIVGDVKKVVVVNTTNNKNQQINNNNNSNNDANDSRKHVSFTDSTKNKAQQQQVSVTMTGLSTPPKNNTTTRTKNSGKRMKKKIKK